MDKIIWRPQKNNKRRIERSKQTKFRQFISRITLSKKVVLRIVFLLFILSLGIFLYSIMSGSKTWQFSKTEYIGVERLNKEELDAQIDSYFGQSIFTLKPSDLEKKLEDSFIEISKVRAEKIYSNKIIFYIDEKIPTILYVNFNGSYLIDQNGEIIRSTNIKDSITYEEDDYDLARGFGSEEADYIEDYIYNSLEEDELEGFDFSAYDPEKKVEILGDLVLQVNTKFSNRLELSKEESLELSKDSVPIVLAWDEEILDLGEQLEQRNVIFFSQYLEKFRKFNFEVERILWDGDLRLFITLDNGSKIISSPNREVDLQIEDLDFILNEVERGIEDIEFIDLSGSKVLVDYR